MGASESAVDAAGTGGWTAYLHERPEIPGWFYSPDPTLFATILQHQFERGVRGDILEIGAFAGKSAILLGYGLGAGETLHVCDPFVFPLLGNDPQRGVNRFLGNYMRYHAQEPDVIVGLSDDLHFDDQSFKFIHIDGSHRFNEVVYDVEFARGLCGKGSVITMDDHSNPMWPGVAAATWPAVVRHELFPFCASPGKLYAAVDADTADEMCAVVARAFAGRSEVEVRRDEIAGQELVVLVRNERPRLARELTPPVLWKWARRLSGRQPTVEW